MDEAYKVKEVAEKFRVHRNTVLVWIKTGKIKAFRISHSWRIPQEEIERITGQGEEK